jgi:hypothetical protein
MGKNTGGADPDLLTVVDLMRLLQTSYRVTLRRIRNDLIPFGAVVKIGTRYYIRRDDLQDWLHSKTVHREPKPRTDSIWMQRRGRNGRTMGKNL